MILYDFPRSSASYRVRIACAIKGIQYDQFLVDFRQNEQFSSNYKMLNKSSLVPSLVDDSGFVITQSLAILQYFDRTYPESPQLIPDDIEQQAVAWEMALMIACDIHPINNLRVLKYIEEEFSADAQQREKWVQHWIEPSFTALDGRVASFGGEYCLGDRLSLVDVCLVPQIFNARRFNMSLDPFPHLTEVDYRLNQLPPFKASAPS